MRINPTKTLVGLIDRRYSFYHAKTHVEYQMLKRAMTMSSQIINLHLRLNVLPNGKVVMKIKDTIVILSIKEHINKFKMFKLHL